MIQKISEKTTAKLISSGVIQTEDSELYEYGVRIFLQDALNILCVFATGLIFHAFTECFFLFLPFALIRKFAGGIHAKKYSVCFCVSNAVMICSVLFIKYLPLYFPAIWVILSSVGLLLIIVFAPVSNPNKQLSLREKIIYKRIAVLITVLLYLIVLAMTLFSCYENISHSISMGIFLASVMTVMGRINYKK